MDTNRWTHDPVGAFRAWQETAATGAGRRPFAPRSVVQHVAMFERFLHHLVSQRVSLATFGPDHVATFLAELERRCTPGTSTRMRYAKLIERLSRHLVETGVRTSHPAGRTTRDLAWPDGEPEPGYLSADADAALQRHVQPRPDDTPAACRNRAIIALLLGSGITSAEIRVLTRDALDLDARPPTLAVPRNRARPARMITLASFAWAPLAAWRAISAEGPASALLFPAPRGGAMNDMFLLLVVREALAAIDVHATELSPRVLRNTYARRQLLDGHSHADVTAMLGLASSRTVTRIRQTLARDAAADRAAHER
ncbi:tyrosine-type recombinase/integrase [Burkholderia sp. AU28942]|uniref:tyrosine-type recombinase/integrase n=1 Tax=Burkholderia TaxID=32008 RepID=UPI00084163FE|nr:MULTISPECIES: tyrosine-type recombinase/integrase [Burkholderia]AOK06380.1 integrase [Burkholderia latens]MBY4697309.1 tyrosine-type recombinase/integrase [Burkholderia latens]MCA8310508.1 tyrosine-type recombinase/integrase [Burkholderia sp. AU28942]